MAAKGGIARLAVVEFQVKRMALLPVSPSAVVILSEKDGGTLLSYSVEAQLGGKLAQLGPRLINDAAKKIVDEFLFGFAATVAGAAAVPTA